MSDENKEMLAFSLLLVLGTEVIKVAFNFLNRGLAHWQGRKEGERRRDVEQARMDNEI